MSLNQRRVGVEPVEVILKRGVYVLVDQSRGFGVDVVLTDEDARIGGQVEVGIATCDPKADG